MMRRILSSMARAIMLVNIFFLRPTFAPVFVPVLGLLGQPPFLEFHSDDSDKDERRCVLISHCLGQDRFPVRVAAHLVSISSLLWRRLTVRRQSDQRSRCSRV